MACITGLAGAHTGQLKPFRLHGSIAVQEAPETPTILNEKGFILDLDVFCTQHLTVLGCKTHLKPRLLAGAIFKKGGDVILRESLACKTGRGLRALRRVA